MFLNVIHADLGGPAAEDGSAADAFSHTKFSHMSAPVGQIMDQGQMQLYVAGKFASKGIFILQELLKLCHVLL